MYHDISSTMLYREYETRVANAIRVSDQARMAQQDQQAGMTTMDQLSAWVAMWLSQVERSFQPAEEGFVA